jgi:hypothetical protein
MPWRFSPTSSTLTSLFSGMTCALTGLIHISQEVDLEKQLTEFRSQTSTYHIQKLKCASNTRPTPLLSNRSMFSETSSEIRGAPSRILLCQAPGGRFQRLLAVRLDLPSFNACAGSPLIAIWNGAPHFQRIVRVESASSSCCTTQQDKISTSHRSNLEQAPNH